MKNVINYYYNLYPKNIFQNAQGYYFFINDNRYMFTKYQKETSEIDKIYNMHIDMLKNKLYVHPIILNINNSPLTYIENIPYILMQTVYYKEKVTIENIISFSKIIINNNYIHNLEKLWEEKNDYLEYQMSMLGKSHPLVKESFTYFIGLGETAIGLLNITDKKHINVVYAHDRITNNYTNFDLYNPLNIKIDSKIRDATEYFKQNFFNGNNINHELNYYFNNTKLTSYEYILFLARMIYPTYYFDIYEEIITDREKEEKLLNIINKIAEYENILKKIYKYFKSFIYIPTIDWLE